MLSKSQARPHCQSPDRCQSRGVGTHCRKCAGAARAAKKSISRKPITPIGAGSVVRFPHRGGKGGRPYIPAHNADPIIDGRTVYGSTVETATTGRAILKPGHNNPKIGALAIKGRWSGMPIYTLTLEERATCPRHCAQWRTCYGNNMHLAERWRHGYRFELLLEIELRALAKKHRDGFIVRLHVLGDFYSVAYVMRWRMLIEAIPALHVFGFTARIDAEDPITRELVATGRNYPDRWMIRFSGAAADLQEMGSEVIDMPGQEADGSIVCPQQLSKTLACATCGLCWQSRRSIAFLRH